MLTTLGPNATLDEVCAVIDRDGGVIVEDFVDSLTLAGLQDDLLPALTRVGWGKDDFAGGKTRRLGAIFKHTRHVVEVARQPLFAGAAKRYLEVAAPVWFGDERAELTPSMQLGVTQAIQIHPGEGGQPLHRDDAVWQWRHPEGGRQARVQVMVAITDFTAENGGTMVIPGSHRWDDDRQPAPDEAVPTIMKAGSGLIWLGGTYHAGGLNTTDRPRTGLTITFDIGWLRQEENHYLSIPREIVASYPEDIQRLLGYDLCPPLTGWVEIDGIMADPNVILHDPGVILQGQH
jgi:ectoine hydroxylase-related dioxygenase (phytanoyl-CoA dioxygenase family)